MKFVGGNNYFLAFVELTLTNILRKNEPININGLVWKMEYLKQTINHSNIFSEQRISFKK